VTVAASEQFDLTQYELTPRWPPGLAQPVPLPKEVAAVARRRAADGLEDGIPVAALQGFTS
jgi:hypothetical protein